MLRGTDEQLFRLRVADDDDAAAALRRGALTATAAAAGDRRAGAAGEHGRQLFGDVVGIGMDERDFADLHLVARVELFDLLEDDLTLVGRSPDDDRVGHFLGDDAHVAAAGRGPRSALAAAPGAGSCAAAGSGVDGLDDAGDVGRVAELTDVGLGVVERTDDVEGFDLGLDGLDVLGLAGIDDGARARVSRNSDRTKLVG
ncbi:MAG: hypothetical protein CHACPFDD_03350 [Phycisphaerae bacterium]|nr:hypothetical protein [Phycisphaerae bacterium]